MTWQNLIIFLGGIISSGLITIIFLKFRTISIHNKYLREKNKKLGETLQMKCNEVENLKSRINQTINKPYI